MFSLSNPPICMPIPRPRGGGARGDTCISSNDQAALYFRKKKKLTTLPNRRLFHVPIPGLTCRASCSTPFETHNFRNALSLSNDHPLCGPNDAGMNIITCGTGLQYWKNGSHTLLGNMFTPPNHPFCRPRGGLFTCLAGRSEIAKSRRAKNKIETKKKEAFDKKKAERKAEKEEKKRKKKGGGKTVRVVKKVMKIGKKKKKTGGKMGASKKRKRNQVLFKLVSTADTNFHYLTSKNRKNHPGKKINLRKYDPVVRRHVQFVETKM